MARKHQKPGAACAVVLPYTLLTSSSSVDKVIWRMWIPIILVLTLTLGVLIVTEAQRAQARAQQLQAQTNDALTRAASPVAPSPTAALSR